MKIMTMQSKLGSTWNVYDQENVESGVDDDEDDHDEERRIGFLKI